MKVYPIPLEAIENIDIIIVKKDGRVNLGIVISGFLNNDLETQKILLKKINNYLEYINSEEFSEEFGKPSPTKTRICLFCSTEPHKEIIEIIAGIKPQVKQWNSSIEIEVRKSKNSAR